MRGDLLERDDRERVGFDWSKVGQVRPGELGIRFGFGAGIALIAAVAGAAFGPKVGGLFLAFPAILPASLTLIEKKEGVTKAWSDASGGALGSVAMAAFALTIMLLLRVNPVLALGLALIAWILVATGLYFLFRTSGLFLRQDQLFSSRR
jgi:hypothetical protein